MSQMRHTCILTHILYYNVKSISCYYFHFEEKETWSDLKLTEDRTKR